MAKVTYHQYRPGRWVKLVDGQVVGPATEEEVARWRLEKAEQTRIWEDVVRRAIGGGEEAEPEPEQPRRAPDGAEDDIWKDVLRATSPRTSAEEPEPRPVRRRAPPPSTLEEAMLSSLRGRPVPVEGGRIVGAEQPPPEPPEQPVSEPAPSAATEPSGALAEPASEDLASPPQQLATAAQPTTAPAELDASPKPVEPAVQEPEAPRKQKKQVAPRKGRKANKERAKDDGLGAPTAVAADAIPPPPQATPETAGRETMSGPPARSAQAATKTRVPDRGPAIEASREIPQPCTYEQSTLEVSEAAQVLADEAELARETLQEIAELPEEARGEGDVAEELAEAPSPEASDVAETRAPRAGRVPRTVKHQPERPRPGAPEAEPPLPSYLWIVAGLSDDLIAAVRVGLERYSQRFEEPAGAVLCHEDDLSALEAAGLQVDVRHHRGLQPRNFWIGAK